MSETRVTTERHGHVFLMGLNRPEKYNAFDLQMLRELAGAFTEFEDDPDMRSAVLFAHGAHFTAGLDLGEVGPAVASGDDLFGEGVDPLGLLGRTRSKPLVQAVQGHCLTIGMELAMAADIVVSCEDAKFGQIEVCRGIMPFGGATIRFAERCGWGDAMRYLLTGDRFDAAEARRIGLVQELAADRDATVERAIALGQTIAKQAPLAVQAALRNARVARVEGAHAAVGAMMEEARRLMASEDALEGLQSFLERREANFRGR